MTHFSSLHFFLFSGGKGAGLSFRVRMSDIIHQSCSISEMTFFSNFIYKCLWTGISLFLSQNTNSYFFFISIYRLYLYIDNSKLSPFSSTHPPFLSILSSFHSVVHKFYQQHRECCRSIGHVAQWAGIPLSKLGKDSFGPECPPSWCTEEYA
jgi:hypothetical protein